MSRIFISYRRDDSADISGRLYDHLCAHFGEEKLFIDVDDIPGGADFHRVLHDEMNRCDVMLVIIGLRWLTVTDQHGRRRLDDPADVVCAEVAAGLKRAIPVNPVLVQGASMPTREALPSKLAALAHRNAVSVRGGPHFRADVNRLIEHVTHALARLSGDATMPPKNDHDAEDPADLVEYGDILYERGRYTQAVPVFERVVRLDPSNADAQFGLAEAYRGAGRVEDALQAYDRWVALVPGDPWPWYFKAVALSKWGRLEEALTANDHAVGCAAAEWDHWQQRADILHALERGEEAREANRHAEDARTHTRTAPAESPSPQPAESVDELLAQGDVLVKLRKHAEALHFFERAAQRDPRSFIAWFNVGHALGVLKRGAEALAAFNRALALDPNNTTAWCNTGAMLNGLGWYADALDFIDQALTLDPNNAAAWKEKGWALSSMGKSEEALTAYERSLTLDPSNAAAWREKGNMLVGQSAYWDAIDAYEQSLALDPDNAETWRDKGNALFEAGDFDGALADFDHALALDPDNDAAWWNKAEALRALRRPAEADEAERRARQLYGWTG